MGEVAALFVATSFSILRVAVGTESSSALKRKKRKGCTPTNFFEHFGQSHFPALCLRRLPDLHETSFEAGVSDPGGWRVVLQLGVVVDKLVRVQLAQVHLDLLLRVS